MHPSTYERGALALPGLPYSRPDFVRSEFSANFINIVLFKLRPPIAFWMRSAWLR
jgi:hypothetical protein